MGFKNLPPFVALAAALITCVITIIYKYDVTKSLLLILGTLILFYIIGSVIKAVLNRTMVVELPPDDEETDDKKTDDEETM